MANFNQTKFQILNLAMTMNRHVEAVDLIYNLDITPENAWKRLSTMWKQGYLLKRTIGKYRISAKGRRVLEKLRVRKEVERVTGIEVSLNLRKSVPQEAIKVFHEVTGKYPDVSNRPLLHFSKY